MKESEIYKILKQHNVSFGSVVVREDNYKTLSIGFVSAVMERGIRILWRDGPLGFHECYKKDGIDDYFYRVQCGRNWPDAWDVEKVVKNIEDNVNYSRAHNHISPIGSRLWSCEDFVIEEEKKESSYDRAHLSDMVDELESLRKENEELKRTVKDTGDYYKADKNDWAEAKKRYYQHLLDLNNKVARAKEALA